MLLGYKEVSSILDFHIVYHFQASIWRIKKGVEHMTESLEIIGFNWVENVPNFDLTRPQYVLGE